MSVCRVHEATACSSPAEIRCKSWRCCGYREPDGAERALIDPNALSHGQRGDVGVLVGLGRREETGVRTLRGWGARRPRFISEMSTPQSCLTTRSIGPGPARSPGPRRTFVLLRRTPRPGGHPLRPAGHQGDTGLVPDQGHHPRCRPSAVLLLPLGPPEAVLQGDRALRTELVISDTRDSGIGRRVNADNWKALRAVGEAANRRLCDARALTPCPLPMWSPSPR